MIFQTVMHKFASKLCSEKHDLCLFLLFKVVKMQFRRDMLMQKKCI